MYSKDYELVGKFVQGDVGLISFFYPKFVVRYELSFLDLSNNVIYTGRKVTKEYLQRNTKSFISLSGIPDIAFDREAQVNLVLSRIKSRYSKDTILNSSNDLGDEEFNDYLKVFYLTKKWLISSDEEVSIYSLFESLVDGRHQALTVLLKLLDLYPPQVIESSLLTFLQRVVNVSEQIVNPNYHRLLKQANQIFGLKIKPATISLGSNNSLRTDLGLFNLLLDLR